jgi:2,3-bisphosphoglycerate-dependent phosphoglycerate mutase
VFSSDLARAAETASIAFAGSSIPVLLDWRLRECDYGKFNATPAAELLANRGGHLDDPYPGGDSWRQAVARVGRFLSDLPLRWDMKGEGEAGGECSSSATWRPAGAWTT